MLGALVVFFILMLVFKRLWPLWLFIAATIVAGPIAGVLVVIVGLMLSWVVRVGGRHGR